MFQKELNGIEKRLETLEKKLDKLIDEDVIVDG